MESPSAQMAALVKGGSQSDNPRLLFVHAHPDDETLMTGGTIARYAAEGAEVRVITCTLGEEGEVIGDRYALLTAGHADQLGGYRVGELTKALAALGIEEPLFLGGPGRWRDSGMSPTRRSNHPTFVEAGDVAVSELADIINGFRPHVIVTYDPKGGYGHPDHVQTHHVTAAAVAASGWKVPKFYWTVLSSRELQAGLEALDDVPPGWIRVPKLGDMLGYADGDIDAVIHAGDHAKAKVTALAAHATQVTLAPDRRSFALSNNIALPVLTEEHYVLAAGIAGPRNEHGWETDLLAGLTFP